MYILTSDLQIMMRNFWIPDLQIVIRNFCIAIWKLWFLPDDLRSANRDAYILISDL